MLVSPHYHCFPNKYRTGKNILAIVFRSQLQIPNFSELIIITGTVFPGNQIKLQSQRRAFSVFSLRLSACQPATPDKS